MKKVVLAVLCTMLLACVFTTVTAAAITLNWNTVLIGDVYYSGVDEISGQDSAAVTGVENYAMYSIVVPENVTYQGTTYPVKYILNYAEAGC